MGMQSGGFAMAMGAVKGDLQAVDEELKLLGFEYPQRLSSWAPRGSACSFIPASVIYYATFPASHSKN
jgi:hypothetical protein